MALPRRTQTGIELYITPNTTDQSGVRTVIERADDNAGSPDSGTWATIATITSEVPFYYTDHRYLDGERYHYRVSHAANMYTSSSTVGPVDAVPTNLEEAI